MCQAVAHSAGANFFNLTPKHTDGKYTGKTVAMMLHMVSQWPGRLLLWMLTSLAAYSQVHVMPQTRRQAQYVNSVVSSHGTQHVRCALVQTQVCLLWFMLATTLSLHSHGTSNAAAAPVNP